MTKETQKVAATIADHVDAMDKSLVAVEDALKKGLRLQQQERQDNLSKAQDTMEARTLTDRQNRAHEGMQRQISREVMRRNNLAEALQLTPAGNNPLRRWKQRRALRRLRGMHGQAAEDLEAVCARRAHERQMAEDWIQKAELAVHTGADDLARDALKRSKVHSSIARDLACQEKLQRTLVEQLGEGVELCGKPTPL